MAEQSTPDRQGETRTTFDRVLYVVQSKPGADCDPNGEYKSPTSSAHFKESSQESKNKSKIIIVVNSARDTQKSGLEINLTEF